MRQIIFALVLIAMSGPSNAGIERLVIKVDDVSRRFLLFTPETAAPPGGRPLLIVLHGGGGTGRQIMRSTAGRFNHLAGAKGALVAYPDAVGRSWDFGEGPVSARQPVRHDDVKFIERMIDGIVTRAPLDRSRVYATGISRGGQMAYALACKRPGLLSGIAPVTMPLPDVLADDCVRIPPTAILMMNGTDDPIVPYDGGPITFGRADRGRVLSSDATMAMFARTNRCAENRHSSAVGAVDRIVWRSCSSPTHAYRVNGGGHTWPGARSLLPRRLVGEINRDIDATAVIWSFFSKL